jgi:hypothetical protein
MRSTVHGRSLRPDACPDVQEGVDSMFEVMALGVIALAAVIIFGVLGAIAALVCWILVLPFKLLGLIFRGFAVLLALPLILAAGIFGFTVFGVGLLFFLIPVVPLLLLVAAIMWLAKRRGHRAVHA